MPWEFYSDDNALSANTVFEVVVCEYFEVI